MPRQSERVDRHIEGHTGLQAGDRHTHYLSPPFPIPRAIDFYSSASAYFRQPRVPPISMMRFYHDFI